MHCQRVENELSEKREREDRSEQDMARNQSIIGAQDLGMKARITTVEYPGNIKG